MPYALLDDQFHANQKIRAAGLEGAGVYALALSYCGDYTTDGYVPKWWIEGVTGRRKKLLQKLVDVDLWHEVRPGDELEMVDRRGNSVRVHVSEEGYFIPDFVLLNVSSVEAKKRRDEKSSAGRKGAIKRWSDSSSHSEDDGTSDSSSHGTSHSKQDGKTMARARVSARTPTPTPQEEPPAAANVLEKPSDAAAAKTIERLDQIGLNATILDRYDHHLVAAWLDLADQEAETNPAGLVITGLRSGQPPSPRTNGETPKVDHAALARELYDRTNDIERVADWLAGLTISVAERERILDEIAA